MLESIASELQGSLNVAEVNISQNKALGVRFCPRALPTLTLMRKGKMYTYKGAIAHADILEFINTGYSKVIKPEKIPGPMNVFQEFIFLYKRSAKLARQDFKNGIYISPDAVMTACPIIILLGLVIYSLYLPSQPNLIDEKKDNRLKSD